MNFPNDIGAIDGKHIEMEQSFSSDSHYRNYKFTDSIVVLANIGPEYEFLYVDSGVDGGNSEGGVWNEFALKNALEQYTLNFPNLAVIPGRNVPLPCVCAGDVAFPLSIYMTEPYLQSNLTIKNKFIIRDFQG